MQICRRSFALAPSVCRWLVEQGAIDLVGVKFRRLQSAPYSRLNVYILCRHEGSERDLSASVILVLYPFDGWQWRMGDGRGGGKGQRRTPSLAQGRMELAVVKTVSARPSDVSNGLVCELARRHRTRPAAAAPLSTRLDSTTSRRQRRRRGRQTVAMAAHSALHRCHGQEPVDIRKQGDPWPVAGQPALLAPSRSRH